MKEILSFLTDLAANNQREWMDGQKPRYQAARKEFEGMVKEFLLKMPEFDPSVAGLESKHCMFRINRDIRFSANKDPYKNNFGTFIAPGGKGVVSAGYYLHVQPGQSFVGGGLYMPPADILKKVRQEIDYNAEEMRHIIGDKSFQSQFNGLEGEQLSRAPKGYSPDHPDIDLLKYKSFVATRPLKVENMSKEELVKASLEAFQALAPLIRFLNVAIA
jgi:uncharacterized protein (TIGR02453 family)